MQKRWGKERYIYMQEEEEEKNLKDGVRDMKARWQMILENVNIMKQMGWTRQGDDGTTKKRERVSWLKG